MEGDNIKAIEVVSFVCVAKWLWQPPLKRYTVSSNLTTGTLSCLIWSPPTDPQKAKPLYGVASRGTTKPCSGMFAYHCNLASVETSAHETLLNMTHGRWGE